MIPPELVAKIRRLHFAEHWKVGTIAKQLGVHHDTVRRVVGIERGSGMLDERVRPTLLDPYKPLIREVLEKHPTLTATRLHEMVKARGYPGTAIQVRRWVRWPVG